MDQPEPDFDKDISEKRAARRRKILENSKKRLEKIAEKSKYQHNSENSINSNATIIIFFRSRRFRNYKARTNNLSGS